MRKRLRWMNLKTFAWVTVVSLTFVWFLNAFVAERTWGTWLAHSLPQAGYAVFPLLLLLAALLKKNWRIAALAVTILLLFPFLFLGLVWGTALEPKQGDITILTYNIHGLESPFPPVEAIIKEIDADVVCLQETGGNSRPGEIAEMAARLGYPHSVINGEIALLSKFEIARSEVVPIEGVPTYRYGIEATLEIDGKELTVMTVHLVPMLLDYVFREQEPNGIGIMQWTSRTGLAQAKDLAGRYHDWPNAVIIAGDHNFNPNGMRYRAMDKEFDDAFAKVGRGFGYTIPSNCPVMRIDYVWTRMCTPVTCEPYPSTASDHKPLVTRIRLY